MSRPGGPLGFEPDEDDRSPGRATDADGGARGGAGGRSPVGAASRHAWLLGAVAVILAGLLMIDATRPSGPGASGLTVGAPIAPFAVALATSGIVCERDSDPCDANVARRAGQGGAGSRPACEVRGPSVLNVCELAERGPLLLGVFATRAERCVRAFDVLDGVARRHAGLRVAVVAIGGELGSLRRLVLGRGWRLPVGWDRDGVLASLLGVATCTHAVAVRRGGRVDRVLRGPFSDADLERAADALHAASRRPDARP